MEWIALCRYAGIGDPPGPLTPKSGEAVSEIWHEAINGITHPAFVVDASWKVLARNQPFSEIFPSDEGPSNALRWMIFEGRSLMAEWDTTWAPHVLPILRTDLAARPDDCVLKGLEEDVLADPRTSRLYGVAGIAPRIDESERPLQHAMHGPGLVKVCMAQPTASPGTRLIFLIFRPGNQKSSPLRSRILRESEASPFEVA
ncbi:XRE family transcriptional regulator [Streptomyces sp. HSW2009]|uniref:MmyB family transcriptional regulator n=1 Tax=Streptomyces sp. HSW2009 TaxID=3142890 RepID=UPI0032EF5D64